VLLLESLDGAGSSPADANLHLATLEHAGFTAQVLLLERRAESRPREEPDEAAYARIARAVGAAELGVAFRAFRPDLVLIASAAAGGGPATEWLPAGTRALWWPTGLDGSEQAPAATGPRAIVIGPSGRTRTHESDSSGGIDASVLDAAAERRVRHGLWDGDYVLVPVPCGPAALRAFAEVASAYDSLDLVLLAHPEPKLQQLAREIGIGTRVHFAGPAPRRAEYAWYRSASAALVSGDGALSGGTVLRLLASGCPIVPVGEGVAVRQLGTWLEARGCAAVTGSDPAARALERAIERGGTVERAIEHGQRLALGHEVESFAPRVAQALKPEFSRGLAAA
jgi:hypothetical protein